MQNLYTYKYHQTYGKDGPHICMIVNASKKINTQYILMWVSLCAIGPHTMNMCNGKLLKIKNLKV